MMPLLDRSPARTLPVVLLVLLGAGACGGPAVQDGDPWPGSVRARPSDLRVAGGDAREQPVGDGEAEAARTVAHPEGGADAQAAPAPGGTEGQALASPGRRPLLAWDGGAVGGAVRDPVLQRDDSTGELVPVPGDRLYLLQLYQDVLAERDRLSDQVQDLRKALGEARERTDSTSAGSADVQARLSALQDEVQRLGAENEDLAGRLATAQIRRLEAEKLLLETRIRWLHERSGGGSAPQDGTLPGRPGAGPAAAKGTRGR